MLKSERLNNKTRNKKNNDISMLNCRNKHEDLGIV